MQGFFNTDKDGKLQQRWAYDAWGARTMVTPSTGNFLFDRGYTMHEHLETFKLINMNGRVYDPILGRFLSPDNFVQDAGSTQAYNRYTYCLNNPLAYTDPSGWISTETMPFQWIAPTYYYSSFFQPKFGAFAGDNYAVDYFSNFHNGGSHLAGAEVAGNFRSRGSGVINSILNSLYHWDEKSGTYRNGNNKVVTTKTHVPVFGISAAGVPGIGYNVETYLKGFKEIDGIVGEPDVPKTKNQSPGFWDILNQQFFLAGQNTTLAGLCIPNEFKMVNLKGNLVSLAQDPEMLKISKGLTWTGRAVGLESLIISAYNIGNKLYYNQKIPWSDYGRFGVSTITYIETNWIPIPIVQAIGYVESLIDAVGGFNSIYEQTDYHQVLYNKLGLKEYFKYTYGKMLNF